MTRTRRWTRCTVVATSSRWCRWHYWLWRKFSYDKWSFASTQQIKSLATFACSHTAAGLLSGRNVLTVRIVDSWQRMKSEFNFPRLFLYSIFESLSPSACDKLSATPADMTRLLSAHSLNLCSSLFIPSWMLCAFALEQFQEADMLEFYSLFCWRCSRCRRLIFINFCYRLSRLFYDLLSFTCLGYKSIYRREEEKKCVIERKKMWNEIENVNKLGK